MKRFQGGLVSKAHNGFDLSILGLRVNMQKEDHGETVIGFYFSTIFGSINETVFGQFWLYWRNGIWSVVARFRASSTEGKIARLAVYRGFRAALPKIRF